VDDLGAGAKLEMVEIPAGEFLMGEDATVLAEFEMDCRRYWDKDTCAMSAKSETPQLRVRVNGFLMGKYEVTQRQWKAVMGSLPPAMNHLDAKLKGDDLPVVYVSWDEIQTFLQKLGRGYRLPSEAEWEYAARAGTRTAFAFGPTVNTDVVNYSGGAPFGQAAKGVYRGRPVAVGGLGLANAWGLYDMHGNVLELCEDNWRDSHNGAPLDGRAWVDISAGASSRVIRGCGWDDPARNCRSASRSKMPGDRAGIVGFRLSRTAR
jgi:formylglycine-generating enzyme required for sulfatase activity